MFDYYGVDVVDVPVLQVDAINYTCTRSKSLDKCEWDLFGKTVKTFKIFNRIHDVMWIYDLVAYKTTLENPSKLTQICFLSNVEST